MNLTENVASMNGCTLSSTGPHGPASPRSAAGKLSVAERRARLVLQCACELKGVPPESATADVHLPISVSEFEAELRSRYAGSHPELIYRTDSTLERARLERSRFPQLPRVILRRGAPPRPR